MKIPGPEVEVLYCRQEDYIWKNESNTNIRNTVTTVCPYCNKEVAADKRMEITQGAFIHETVCYNIIECPVCMRPIILDFVKGVTYPTSLPFGIVKHVPETITLLYDECRRACGARCYTATVILARTILNHIAVEQGAKENQKFIYYVNYLVEKGYAPPNSKNWVDRIRELANDSVHDLEIRKKEEAELIVKLLMYLLKYIYELPNEMI